jgi:hypothetical protein
MGMFLRLVRFTQRTIDLSSLRAYCRPNFLRLYYVISLTQPHSCQQLHGRQRLRVNIYKLEIITIKLLR